MNPLLVFLIAFTHRVLSGWQSMYLYQARSMETTTIRRGIVFTTLILVFMAIGFTIPRSLDISMLWAIIKGTFLAVMITSVILKILSFLSPTKDKWLDIHLWESVVTGSFWLYLAITGHDLIALCCSVYPALIIHKGLINKGNGLKFFDQRTDDATGKTYSIPFLKIKVPRSSLKMRFLFTVLSLVVFIMCYIFGVTISI